MADTKITNLTEKAVGVATDEFIINDAGIDNKLGMDGIRIIQSQITDTTITATNLNILDDAADTTLHFHDADRARANHTGTQLASTVSDFDTQVRTSRLDQMATTTSAQLITVISDETGSGALVFATSPTFITPVLGTPTSGVATNLTGTSGITGLGVQTQALDMDGNDIILDAAGNIRIDNSVANVTTLKHPTNYPNFTLLRDQIIPDGSTAGKVRFRSKDSDSVVRTFGEIRTIIEDTTVAGNLVHGSLHIRVRDANVETTYMNFNDAKSGQIDVLKKATFNPNATDPGLNFGSQAGDPSTLVNGDAWYNSTTNKIRAREAGATVNMIGGGGLWTVLGDYEATVAEASHNFNFTAVNFDDDSHLVLVIDVGATASFILSVRLNGILTSNQSTHGRRIRAGAETLLNITGQTSMQIASATVFDAADSDASIIVEIFLSKAGIRDRPKIHAQVNASSNATNEQTTSFIPTATANYTDVEVRTSTSTWQIGTRMTLYKVARA